MKRKDKKEKRVKRKGRRKEMGNKDEGIKNGMKRRRRRQQQRGTWSEYKSNENRIREKDRKTGRMKGKKIIEQNT